MFFRLAIFIWLVSGLAYSQYEVTELDGGPLKRKLFSSFYVNQNSSLRSKIFLLNHPACGMVLKGTVLSYGYEERKNVITADASGEITKPIVALSYRVTLYSVYGEHIMNLGAGEIKDYEVGEFKDHATWHVYDEDVLSNLTAVVYVYKARFSDGTVWRVNIDELQAEMSKLSLTELKENEKNK